MLCPPPLVRPLFLTEPAEPLLTGSGRVLDAGALPTTLPSQVVAPPPAQRVPFPVS